MAKYVDVLLSQATLDALGPRLSRMHGTYGYEHSGDFGAVFLEGDELQLGGTCLPKFLENGGLSFTYGDHEMTLSPSAYVCVVTNPKDY